MLLMAMLLFPKLALGLSGFETGVAVMPLVRGDDTDTEQAPLGRIRNTKKLLRHGGADHERDADGQQPRDGGASFRPSAFQPRQPADGRALAYLAHELIGNGFGTVYDIATIAILWFAGASAMAGLLNLVPRYLPRYGMAPEWARATRPLVALFTGITFLVTIIFDANVDAQGGAYATGVLVLMSSAALAVAIMAWRQRRRYVAVRGRSRVVFIYTTVTNIFERPEGHQDRLGVHPDHHRHVAGVARAALDRAARRRHRADELASAFIAAAASDGEGVRIIANRPRTGAPEEYAAQAARSQRCASHPGRALRCCFSRSARATRRSSAKC